MTGIDIREITALDEIESMRETWTALVDDSHQATVFSSWEWQYAAAKHLIVAGRPCILAAFLEDELVGILPLTQRKIKIGGLIPSAALACLGGVVTDYNPLLVRKGFLSRVIPALASHLERIGLPVALENVLPGSPLDILGRYLRNSGFHSAQYESKSTQMTRLSDDYDTFMRSRKKKFRGVISNNASYMIRTGGYTYHSENPTGELLDTLIRLHTARWKHKGESGAFSNERVRKFHAELHKRSNAALSIRYYTIRHNGDIIAILYGFLFKGRFYFYQSGFSADHRRISPGNMIINYCIRNLYDENVEIFDMLRGETKYKQSWATTSYDMADTIYFPRTVSGRMLHVNLKTLQAIKKAVPAAIKSRLRPALSDRNE